MDQKRRGFIIHCDTCDAETHEINSDNEVVAQRVATTFLHWKVYKEGVGWKRACPGCVRKFNLNKQKSRSKNA